MGLHTHLPRSRTIGPLRLDLFHRDACINSQWLRLFPKEFALLWRLAEDAGQTISKSMLFKDVWRLKHPSESNRIEVHISRIRSKLHTHRLAWLIETDPAGGYRLVDPGQAAAVIGPPLPTDSLDSISCTGIDRAKTTKADEHHDISEE